MPGCENPTHARSLCGKHYKRWWRRGDPSVVWEWQGSGPDHWTRRLPERVATGERNGAHTHPERRPSGDRNGGRTKPESVPRGERNGTAKLTAADVQRIRALYATGRYTQHQLGELFGMGQPQVGCIVRREAWAHVQPPEPVR